MATGKNFDLTLTIRALDKATGPLREFNTKMRALTAPVAKLGNAFKGFGTELGLSKLGNALGGVGSAFKNAGGEVLSLGKAITGMVAGALFGGFGLYTLVRGAVESGAELARTAGRVGLTVDAYAQLEYAARKAGIGQEEFGTAMDFFNKSLGQAKAGTGSLFSLLEKASPKLLMQVKAAKDNGAAFDVMVAAMFKLQDPTKRAALAAAAFGRSGLRMADVLKGGAVEIAKARAEYIALAGSQEKFARQSEELDVTFAGVDAAFTGLKASALGELMPAFRLLADALKDFIAQNRGKITAWASDASKAITAWVQGGGIQRLVERFEEISTKIGRVVDALGGLKGALVLVGVAMGAGVLTSTLQLVGALGQLGFAILGVTYRLAALAFAPIIAAVGNFVVAIQAGYGVMEAFNLVLIANPIGLVITAIGLLAGAAYLIYKHWGPIKAFFLGVWDGLVSGIKKAWNFVEPYLEKIGEFLLKFTGLGAEVGALKWLGSKLFGSDGAPPRPTLGAGTPAPAGGSTKHETKVTIDIKNLPPGSRASQVSTPGAQVDLNRGYSMVGG